MGQWRDNNTLEFGDLGDTILVRTAPGVVEVRGGPGATAGTRVGTDKALDFSTLVPAAVTTGDVMTTGTTWVQFSTAGACGIKLLLENICATGEFATLRIRAGAKNATASGNGNNSIGTTTCADLSASANADDYGNLKALNACAQPNAFNQTKDATNIVTAVYGRIDATGTSLGRRWVAWFDTHATTKAAGGDYMCRISHNGTAAIDGAFSIYSGGRLPQLITFEDILQGSFLTTSGSGTFTKTHKLAVKIAGDATQYYIQMGTIA